MHDFDKGNKLKEFDVGKRRCLQKSDSNIFKIGRVTSYLVNWPISDGIFKISKSWSILEIGIHLMHTIALRFFAYNSKIGPLKKGL